MTVLRSLLLIVSMLFTMLATPVSVSAHQSGCHRWHSCPSDTGSYVCGDLGYYSECGSTPTYADPDYADQGTDNGSQKADDDNALIRTSAETDAEEAGHNDGSAGDIDSPSPDSSTTCDKTFSYETPQPQKYVDAFHDSYLEACTMTYESAYNDAYEAAYQAGVDESKANDQQVAKLEEVSVKTPDSSGYWWLAGLGLLGIPALVGKLRKK